MTISFYNKENKLTIRTIISVQTDVARVKNIAVQKKNKQKKKKKQIQINTQASHILFCKAAPGVY